MSKVKAFSYRQLTKACEIRLLKLQPSEQFDAPLIASLQHCDLGKELNHVAQEATEDWTDYLRYLDLESSKSDSYEAISYAWGEGAPTASLHVQDEGALSNLAVRPNVDHMLRHLRFTHQERLLWIDSLCINQTDAKEKEQQVSFMSRIYSEADSVLVWLGPSKDGLEDVGYLFDDLSTLDPNYEDVRIHSLLATLLHRPWFRRRWIVQEVLLAKRTTLLCGHHAVDLTQFTKYTWKASQHGEIHPVLADILRKLCAIHRFRDSSIFKGRSAILGVLVVFHEAECSDDRDRVYALDGITSWKVPVSYTESVEETYLRYAMKHIEYENVALLNCCGAFTRATHRLPSWVPDWRVGAKYTPVTTGLNLKYDTEAFKGSVHISGSKAILSVMGSFLATVRHVGAIAPYPAMERDLLSLLMDWYALLVSSTETYQHKSSTRTRVSFIETVTLGAVETTEAVQPSCTNSILMHLAKAAGTDLKDTVSEPERPQTIGSALQGLMFSKSVWSRFDLTLYATIFGGLGRREARDNCFMGIFDDSPKDFIRVLQHTAAGRRCFFMDDGTFGLGPAAMQPGDIIVEIQPGYTPYVLRPVGWQLSKLNAGMAAKKLLSHRYYAIVGDCYIHSFTSGSYVPRNQAYRSFDII